MKNRKVFGKWTNKAGCQLSKDYWIVYLYEDYDNESEGDEEANTVAVFIYEVDLVMSRSRSYEGNPQNAVRK